MSEATKEEKKAKATTTVSAYYATFKKVKDYANQNGMKVVFIMDKAVQCLQQHQELLDAKIDIPSDEVSRLERAIAVHPDTYNVIKSLATAKGLSVRDVVARAVECYFSVYAKQG